MGGRVEIGDLPLIEAESTQIRHLFLNLVDNSIKFSKRKQAPVVKIYGKRTDDSLKIFVEDNGIGFDEQYLDRIFRPFQQLHRMKGEYEGTGIGLAVCRKVAELHGGSITARSTPESGATFIVTLPIRNSRERLL